MTARCGIQAAQPPAIQQFQPHMSSTALAPKTAVHVGVCLSLNLYHSQATGAVAFIATPRSLQSLLRYARISFIDFARGLPSGAVVARRSASPKTLAKEEKT